MSDFLAQLEAREQRRARVSAPVTPVALGLVAGLVILFFLLPAAGGEATRIANAAPSSGARAVYFGGALLVSALLATTLWALVNFAFVRPSRPRWGPALLALQLLLTVGAGLGLSAVVLARADEKAQMRTAAAEMQRIVGGFVDHGLAADIGDTRPRARGDAGEIERTLKEGWTDIQASARSYEADVKGLELDRMTPARLARADLGALITDIHAARARTETYREDVLGKIANFRTRIETSTMSPANKRAYLAGFDKGFGATRVSLERMLDLQEEALTVSEQQIRFLRSRRSGWLVQNNMIMFRKRSDMVEFNAMATRVAAVNGEIAAMQAQQQARMRQYNRELGEHAAAE